jgi:pimeloyl-ACP methyl ester carboxylesterase
MNSTGSRAVQRRELKTADGLRLQTAHFHVPDGQEKAILLVPPLIGGSFILFGRQFQFLVRSGYRIVSFNYRGHRPSEGRFDLKTSFEDTEALARQLRQEYPGVPIGAIGICSGSLPIFYILDRQPDFFWKLVFVNAIHHIQQTATPIRAVRMYVRKRGWKPPSSAGDAVSAILDEVFPEIDKSPDHFGILPYDNANRGRLAWEYFLQSEPRIRGLQVPTLCCYGLGDAMLGLADERAASKYRQAFAARFPTISYETFRADHFMTGLKEQVAQTIQRFLDQ